MEYSIKGVEDRFGLKIEVPFHFSGKVCRETLIFLKFFDQYCNEIFEKYTTYTHEEITELYDNNPTSEEVTIVESLKFHLQNRKALKEVGMSVPLYINQNFETN